MTSYETEQSGGKVNEFESKYDNVNSESQQCKKFNSRLMLKIIQLERNAVANS